MVQMQWKTVWWFFNKLKVELPYDPATPLLGVHPKELKAESSRDTCTWMSIAALFTTAERWKQPQCPLTDEA